MAPMLAALLRLSALRRRADLDERSTVLVLFARFTDEVASGLLVVLMPTLRARLGLSVSQVGWCFQALYVGGALVEPASAVAVDLHQRRPLLVVGAAGWAAALLLAAGAPSFLWLLAAFAIAGAAYGPLTTTADVVLVEGHPDDAERITSRSTAIDTLGALLAPATVALAGWWGADPRWLLGIAGLAAVAYTVGLATTRLPRPPGHATTRPLGAAMANLRAVLADRRARPWLLALVLLEVADLPELFEPVWLRDVVEMSQTMVALHVALGMVATLVTLVLLDRWSVQHDALPVVVVCCLVGLVVYPAWLLTPGILARFVLVVPRNAAMAPLWPILRARALAAVPERAGALSALTSLVSLVPLAAGVGWLGERFGLTPVLLLVQVGAVLGVLGVLRPVRADA